MKPLRIIVVGASAGGVEALVKMMSNFNIDADAAAFIVLHVSPDYPSYLPEILSRRSEHPAVHPKDDEVVKPGTIYIAPPNHHMIFSDGRIELTRGPLVNLHRPSIDELFCSAAQTYGDRVIGVILSGSMNDGAIGIAAIKKAGGIAVVQDPDEAIVASMPDSAIAAVHPDYIVPSPELGALLSQLVKEKSFGNPITSNNSHGSAMEIEERIEQDFEEEANDSRDNIQSIMTCPECGGVLWEQNEGGTINFSCHQGHKLTAEVLIGGQSQKVEEALWTAVRLMKEKAVLCRKLSARLTERGSRRSAESFSDHAESLEQHLLVLRNVLIHDESLELNERATETL